MKITEIFVHRLSVVRRGVSVMALHCSRIQNRMIRFDHSDYIYNNIDFCTVFDILYENKLYAICTS